MSAQPPVSARVTPRFTASPEHLFDAWLDGAKVRQWFAPGRGEMVRVEIDARVGGSFSFAQRRGSQDIDHVGNCLGVRRTRPPGPRPRNSKPYWPAFITSAN